MTIIDYAMVAMAWWKPGWMLPFEKGRRWCLRERPSSSSYSNNLQTIMKRLSIIYKRAAPLYPFRCHVPTRQSVYDYTLVFRHLIYIYVPLSKFNGTSHGLLTSYPSGTLSCQSILCMLPITMRVLIFALLAFALCDVATSADIAPKGNAKVNLSDWLILYNLYTFNYQVHRVEDTTVTIDLRYALPSSWLFETQADRILLFNISSTIDPSYIQSIITVINQ